MATVFETILTDIDTVAAVTVTSIYAGFNVLVLPFITKLLIISMVFFGISVMMGWIEYPMKQFAKMAIKIVMVLALVSNWVYFDLFLYGIFTNSPDAIGSILLSAISSASATPTPSSATGLKSAIGILYEQGMLRADYGYASGGIIMPFVLGIIIQLSVLFLCGFAIALLGLSKIGMACVLSLGPIFIIFLLFDATRQMFSSWLQQVFNFGFVSILTYVILIFFIGIFGNAISNINTTVVLGDLGSLLLISFIGSYVFSQIPGIASGLAGGAQVTTLGSFSRASNRLAGGAGDLTKRGGNKLIKGGGRLLQKGGSTLKTAFTNRRNNSIRRK